MWRVLLLAFCASVACADYKSGIDITFSGTKGVDWDDEPQYHDPLVTDRRVIYIRSATTFTLTHNSRNVARVSGSFYHAIGANGLDGIAGTGDEGVIRYKVDGDLNWGPLWTSGQGGTANPAYSAPLSFAALTYPAAQGGLSVLGRTGNNGGSTSSKSAFFTYGLLDDFGDEWHTIQVADDDWNVTAADSEWRASDGKVFLFVVNPKTPCLSVSVTGDAQFYNTPAKVYFMPKIHAQTTYMQPGTGSVSIRLRDINGNNIFYRLGTSGAFTAAGSSSVTLPDSFFSSGSNTLQYYSAGNQAYTKTRIVVKNPGFPSAGETHGYVLAGDETNAASMLTRKALQPYKHHYDRAVNGSSDSGGRTEWDSVRNQGLRFVPNNGALNAIIAKMNGVASVPSGKPRSFAAYAKEMILQNARTIDPIGFEGNWSQTTQPTRELYYRGYYDVSTNRDLSAGYDLLISFFRSDQVTGGITPIEDYFLRDCIASTVMEAMMFVAKMQGSAPASDTGGMWDTALKCGAVMSMFAIPSYSTPYYGTCGLDGNVTVYPYTPFPTVGRTWKQIFLDENTSPPGFPNQHQTAGFGLEQSYLYTKADGVIPDGNWLDKNDYLYLVNRHVASTLLMLKYLYPAKTFPLTESFLLKAAQGTVLGKLDNSGPSRVVFLNTFNSKFPAIADVGVPYVQGLDDADPESDNQAINGFLLNALVGYDVEWESSSPPVHGSSRSGSALRFIRSLPN